VHRHRFGIVAAEGIGEDRRERTLHVRARDLRGDVGQTDDFDAARREVGGDVLEW
jgi:hypothetical protein